MNKVDIAVVPAAGFGSRLRPITHAIPKEMIPIGRKPVLHHIVDEMVANGISNVCFVISPEKDCIKTYFGNGSSFGLKIHYVLQEKMMGLGDAILQAADWIDGQPFAVLFGDTIIQSQNDSAFSRLTEAHVSSCSFATVLTQTIPRDRSFKYGIIRPEPTVRETDLQSFDSFTMTGIVEKPKPELAPSNQAVAARWVFQPEILDALKRSPLEASGEKNLTAAVSIILNDRAGRFVPLRSGEQRLDIGGWDSYLKAVTEYALHDEDYGTMIREYITGVLTR